MSASPLSRSDLLAAIDAVVAAQPFGDPCAVKRGRDPRWPYVAVLRDYYGVPGRTHNPLGRSAFATAGEAVAAAGLFVLAARAKLRRDLAEPRMRALREFHGLPSEIGEG